MNTDIAWAAGILEGEGSFNQKNSYAINISCNMTDLDVLEKLQRIFGGNIYTVKKRKEHWKQSWVWSLNGKEALHTVIILKPYMMSRRSTKIQYLLNNYYAKAKILEERSSVRETNGIAAAKYYLSMEKPSLRKVSEQFHVCHETVRKYVARMV